MKTKTVIIGMALLLNAMCSYAQNWFQIQTGTSKKLNTIDFPSANIGYIGGNDSLILKTIDGGEHWTPLNYSGVTFYPNGEHIINLKFVTETIGFMAVGPYTGSYKTTDGGLTWTALTSLTTCFNEGLFFFDENNGFVGGSGCFQGEKIDRLAANIWSTTTINTPTNSANNRITDIDFLNPSFGLAASSSGYILRTTDGGNNWDTIPTSGFTMNPITAVLIVSNNLAYAAYESLTSGFGLYISTDMGLTWQPDANSATFLYPNLTTLHKSGNNFIYTGGNSPGMQNGVIFESPNNPAIWNYYTVDEFINDLSSYNDSIVFAVGDSGYVIANKDFSSPQGLNTITEDEFMLYPNPATSLLICNIKGMENAQLKIYSTTGTLVYQEKFKYSIDVTHLPTGLYFITIANTKKSITKKILKN